MSVHRIIPTRGLRVYKTTNSAPSDSWFVGSIFEREWKNQPVGSILVVEMIDTNKPEFGGVVIYLDTTDNADMGTILVSPSWFTTEHFHEVDAAEGPLFMAADFSRRR